MIATPEFLKARLAEGGVLHAAVVDDAFDEDKAIAKVTHEDEFWAEVEAHPQWKEVLSERQIPCADFDTFRSRGLVPLWRERRKFSGEIATALNALFIEADEALGDPQKVAEHLGSLGLEVVPVGTKPKQPMGSGTPALPTIPPEIELVFLDYDIEGVGASARAQTRLSERVASHLAERKERTPFLVLFSNKPNARLLAETFRKRTGYLRGTFTFISKEEARDVTKLCNHLSDTCIGQKGLGHLQHFFFALKRRLAEVAASVESQVMQLNVQDHAFIQRLALQEEGATLGEYMLDFFGAVLSHELRDGPEVQEAKRLLDAFPFEERHFPFSDLPSAPIQRLYRAVLTEPGISDATPHPRAVGGKAKSIKGKDYKAPPLLMFGDVFIKSARSPVYVVLNPACDLQYSPKRRDPKLDASVLLMEGKLEPLTKARSGTALLKTECLEFNERHWRVTWEHQRVESIKLGSFDRWRKKKKYKRVARLSLPYGLKLQQIWLAELGRVGLPVNLPIYDAFDVQVLCLDSAGQWQPFGPRLKRAAIVSRHPRDTKDVSHFTLTPKGRNFVFERLCEAKGKLTEYSARSAAAEALLKQAKIWNEGLTETPHKFTSDYHEDIAGLLFAWRYRPQLKGLAKMTDAQKNKLSELEQKAIAKQEKVALIVVLNPAPARPAAGS
jgi:hypothetical protein